MKLRHIGLMYYWFTWAMVLVISVGIVGMLFRIGRNGGGGHSLADVAALLVSILLLIEMVNYSGSAHMMCVDLDGSRIMARNARFQVKSKPLSEIAAICAGRHGLYRAPSIDVIFSDGSSMWMNTVPIGVIGKFYEELGDYVDVHPSWDRDDDWISQLKNQRMRSARFRVEGSFVSGCDEV